MICLIAPNYHLAQTWARGQQFDDSEWFFGTIEEVKSRTNFHVIVVGTMFNMPNLHAEMLLNLAWKRGRIGRT